jgi:hypothetical protein
MGRTLCLPVIVNLIFMGIGKIVLQELKLWEPFLKIFLRVHLKHASYMFAGGAT